MGFGVWGLGFGVQGFGFWVFGFGAPVRGQRRPRFGCKAGTDAPLCPFKGRGLELATSRTSNPVDPSQPDHHPTGTPAALAEHVCAALPLQDGNIQGFTT